MTTDIDPAIQQHILEDELSTWRNTRYMYQVRYRVYQGLGDAESTKRIEAELIKCERAIDMIKGYLTEVNHDGHPAASAGD